MEKRTARVSEAQWSILLEFLERHPSLARARGYNNSAQGRAASLRLWSEVAMMLNAEGSGTTKTPKDWSIYVSNYKSKLKKIVADINADASGTGGGRPQGSSISALESRFLAIMGPGFGQTAHGVRVEPFSNEPSIIIEAEPLRVQESAEHVEQFEVDVVQNVLLPDTESAEHVEQFEVDVENVLLPDTDGRNRSPISVEQPAILASASHGPPDAEAPPLPRATRQRRYRSRPLAPLDEARRILSQVEMQRAAADAATASALNLIGQNLGRLADAFEGYFARLPPQ